MIHPDGASAGLEDRLRSAEALVRMAARVGRLGAWSFDLGSEELIWSEEVCAIHEVAPGFRPTLANAVEFYTRWSRDTQRNAFRECMDRGTPYELELQIVTARGRVAWVRSIGVAERGADGTVIRVQGACQDVTTSKQAAEHNRVLAERLTMTLESMTDGFFTIDREWRFTYMNAQAARLLQCDRAAMIGKVIWDEFAPAIGSDFHHCYEHALTANEPVEMESFYPPLHIWIQLRAYPSPQGLAVSFRDVTDRVRSHQAILALNSQLEDRVRARTAELEAANCELETFSYSVAHDLRSPLAALSAFGQMLESTDDKLMSDSGKLSLRRIQAATAQMDSMTRGLLDLARLSGAPLRQEQVDLSALALRLMDILMAQSPQRESEIVVHPQLRATGDEALLTQLLSNLLGNAWKFSARCAVARIEVGSLRDVTGQPVYFVRDNGAGFDMASAARLFKPFLRLHSDAEYEGTGIGLATVERIVYRHQGRVWAEASAGRGATFFFTLGQ